MPRFAASLDRARADFSRSLDIEERYGLTGHDLALAISARAAHRAIGSRSDAVAILDRPDWRDRAAGLIVLAQDTALPDAVIHKFVQTAFDDESPEARGFALLSIYNFSKVQPSMEILLRELRGVFAQQSGDWLRERGADIATDWINALSMHVSAARTRRRCDKFLAEQFSRRAGADAANMLRGQGTAAKYLDHPNADRRMASLQIIGKSGKMGLWAEAKLRNLASTDPDPGVRIAAVGAFGMVYNGTLNPSAEKFLASIVIDDMAPILLREIAYHALYCVHDVPVLERPDSRAALRNTATPFTFPDDMDIEFVQRCLHHLG